MAMIISSIEMGPDAGETRGSDPMRYSLVTLVSSGGVPVVIGIVSNEGRDIREGYKSSSYICQVEDDHVDSIRLP